jgi:ABC-2 type transport system permease protein
MGKIPIIFKKEYLEKIKSKAFIITTILLPLVMSSFILIPVGIELFTSREEKVVAVYDRTGKVFPVLKEAFEEKKTESPEDQMQRRNPELIKRFRLTQVNLDNPSERAALIQDVESSKVSGYVMVAYNDSAKTYDATFHGKSLSDFNLQRRLQVGLNKALTKIKLADAGLGEDKIKQVETQIDLKQVKLTAGKEEKSSGEYQFIAAYIMAMILYVTMLIYGIMVMNAVIEEKSSRVMEVMISSVKPAELMLGKVLAIGAVGLTQYAIWAGVGIGLSASSLAAMSGSGASLGLSPMIFVYFVLFFVLGYLMFAMLYAAIGSAVENAQDAQSFQTPVTMLIVIPIIMISFVIQKPDAPFSVIMSLIPIFSPILMIARISVTDVPLWQTLLSLVLMSATAYGLLTVSSKIYRVGILMYGKKPTLAELIRWTKYS